MEDIAADDDLLSDMLVDSLEHNPPIHTHKMNQSFRAPRYKTEAISDIVRRHVVIDHDVASAVDALCRLGVVQKHLNAKRDERQRQEFRSHAKRYFEMYLPDGGVEFALTVRYQMTATKSMQAESSRSGQAHAEERARVQAAAAAAREAAPAGRQAGHKGKARASETTEVLGQSMADLCVVATKPFKAGELVKLCRGGVKDLNKQEDEALKEEAALGRERRKEQSYNGVLGPGRDFSIIRSSRKMCSQLLLGPARFVNHDCQPNCEFYRLGSHNMTFRCLRDIGINEEITTFYGENYFEVDNAECMCSTCEERGVGIFARFPKKDEDAESVEDVKSNLSPQERPGKGARRVSSRKPKTPPPVAQPVPRTAVLIKRKNGKEYYKTFLHVISGREDDGEVFPHTGSRFHCMTCGEPTWSSETWWSPDECRRCEHHYQIFKADWPSRTPTEGEWQDKAEASRLRRQLAGDNRTLKTADYLLTSGEATPEADSPIAFEPLAGPSRTLTAEAKSKRPSSLTPSSASAMRKKKRVVSDDEQADTALPSVKSEDQSKQGKQKKKAATRESDAESELTSVSTQDGDETVRATQTSGRASPMSSSSSTSDRPLGPKSLGKHAKTETLAQFWGNIEDGNKRARRPVNNGLESLSATVQRPGNGKHRRTASDMTALSSQTKPVLSPPVKAGVSVEETDQLAEIVKQPDTASASTSASVSGVNGHKERTISRTVSESQAAVHIPKHDPLLDESGLATRGPERTSNSNLAKAWGADLEGGRGSRRRAALRQASTPTMLSSPRLSRRSDSRDVQSPTPPVVKSGGKPSSTGVMTPRSGSPPRIAAKIADFPPRDPTAREDDQRDTLPVADRAEAANFHDASSSAQELPFNSPSRSHSSSPALSTPSASVDPIAMPTLKTATAPQPDMPKNERTSTAMPIDRLLNPEQVANPRVISPLAGPPPAANAAHPFVVGGQPVRKNLRWGKGKVTTSRPIGGSSPLAGSAATARPCSPLAGPTSHQSSTPPTFVGIAASLQSPGPRSPNSPLEPAREPVRLPSLLQALSADERRAVVKTNGASPVTNTSLPASSQATPTKTADVPPSPRASSRASMPDGHGSSASLKRSYSDLSDEHYAPAKRAGSNGHGPSHANAKMIKEESNGH